MRKVLLATAAILALIPQARAADSTVPAMTAAGSVVGTDLFYCVQSGGTLDRKCTPAQMAAYVYGLTSGDATISGTGAVTFATVNGNVGSFGSSNNCVAITVNAKGLITGASASPCTPAIASVTGTGTGVITALGINVGTAGSFVVNGGALGTPSSGVATNLTGTAAGLTAGNVTTNANLTGAVTSVGNATSLGSFSSANLLAALTTKTGTGNAVFGSAPTIDSLNATTAMTLAFLTGGGTQCVQVSNTGAISGTGAVCGGAGSTGANPTATAGPTAVNGVATTFMRSDGAPAIQLATAAQKGIVQVDGTTIQVASGVISAPPAVTSRSVTGTTDTILAADLGNVIYYNSASAVAVTIPAPSGSFASGYFTTVCNVNAGTLTLTPSSGTIGGAASSPVLAGTEAQPRCTAFQSNGTNYRLIPDYSTQTIASGTATLGVSLIASGACATVVTVAATNVATTDTVLFGYNSDPTAVAGYGASASGAVLTIYPYPTAGNVNVKVCNSTSASITPGAMTLNWRVPR